MDMLYVILVAAIIIFWLVAIDRPILFVARDIFRQHSNITLSISLNMNLFQGKLRCINKGLEPSWRFRSKSRKRSSKESATYSHTKALHGKARH